MLDKVLFLAHNLTPTLSLDKKLLYELDSPGKVVRFVRYLAEEVCRESEKQLIEAGGFCYLKLFFVFLRSIDERLSPETISNPSFPADPLYSWMEAQSSEFIQFEYFIQDVWEHYALSDGLDRINALLEVSPNETIIDFGAGAGYYAYHLSQRAGQYHCIETNAIKIKFLHFMNRYKLPHEQIGINPQTLSRCDWLLLINVLDHLEDPESTLTYFSDLLKPGGVLVYAANFEEDGWHNSSAKSHLAIEKYIDTFYEPIQDPTEEYSPIRRYRKKS
jgi:hypothetical protein